MIQNKKGLVTFDSDHVHVECCEMRTEIVSGLL